MAAMTTKTRVMWRWARWALCGGAFALVIAAAAGCGFTTRTASPPMAATNAAAPVKSDSAARDTRRPIFDNRRYIGIDDPTASVTRIPVINVFGELDGTPPA